MLWITSSLFYFDALLYQTYLRVQRHLVTQNLGWCYIDIAAAVWITPVTTKREHLRFPWCISSLSSGEHHLGSHGSKLAWNSGKRTGNMYTNSAHDILAIWCLERNTPGELGQYLTLWLQVINTHGIHYENKGFIFFHIEHFSCLRYTIPYIGLCLLCYVQNDMS